MELLPNTNAKKIIIKKHGGPEVLELHDVKLDNLGRKKLELKNTAIGLKILLIHTIDLVFIN